MATVQNGRIVYLEEPTFVRCSSQATLVTAYHELSELSKHSTAEYTSWLTNFLSLADNMVIFTTETELQALQEMRQASAGCSVFVIQALQETFTYQSFNWTLQAMKDPEKEFHQSTYLYVIWNEKSHWLLQSSRLDPFQSDYFFWTDSGQFRNTTEFKISQIGIHRTWIQTISFIPYGKIVVLSILPFTCIELTLDRRNHTIHFDTRKARLGGGNFGGDKNAVEKWHRVYYRVLERYFEEEAFAGKDQVIMATSCIENKEMCHIIDADKVVRTGKVSDPWFALQPVLHGELDVVPLYSPIPVVAASRSSSDRSCGLKD